jgi:uncharacterized membrane protein
MPTTTAKDANKLHHYFLQIAGIILLLAGIVILIIVALYDFAAPKPRSDDSSLAATGFFAILLGIAMLYPDMLKGPDNSTSAMRVAVFMVVSVFVILTIKVFWSCDAIERFKLDHIWAYVLGIALGGKVVQSAWENNIFGGRQKGQGNLSTTDLRSGANKSSGNPLFTSPASATAIDYHDSTIRQPPNQPPASVVANSK